MAIEKFEDRKFTGKINVACKYDDGTVRYWNTTKEEVVHHIRQIVTEYAKEGYVLTLRQLHYQLVTQNWIINHDTAYKKLGGILDDCRYGGKIDWNAIEDRGRVPYIPYSIRDVEHAMQDTVDQYRIDRQRGQTTHIELWTEKDALSGILKRTTEKYHIQLIVNKGYTSSSAIYGAYKRCVQNLMEGKSIAILYFGDHDPSGLDMIRDIRDRLTLFLCNGNKLRGSYYDNQIQTWWDDKGYDIYDVANGKYCSDDVLKLLSEEGEDCDDLTEKFEQGKTKMFLTEKGLFNVIPIGLTIDQIKKYKLPPNPTKLTDSRADKYIKKYGKTCWEVDALKPQVLTQIVETNIQEHIDIDTFNEMIDLENEGIEKLKKIISNLDEQ